MVMSHKTMGSVKAHNSSMERTSNGHVSQDDGVSEGT